MSYRYEIVSIDEHTGRNLNLFSDSSAVKFSTVGSLSCRACPQVTAHVRRPKKKPIRTLAKCRCACMCAVVVTRPFASHRASRWHGRPELLSALFNRSLFASLQVRAGRFSDVLPQLRAITSARCALHPGLRALSSARCILAFVFYPVRACWRPLL